jgi:hypothetical protein
MSREPSQTKDWADLFAKYRGQWVALADDELTVLAAGATAKDALAASVAKGSSEPNPLPSARQPRYLRGLMKFAYKRFADGISQ